MAESSLSLIICRGVSKNLCFCASFKLKKTMHFLIDEYLNFMTVEKGASRNTIDGYSRDLNRYAAFHQRTENPGYPGR